MSTADSPFARTVVVGAGAVGLMLAEHLRTSGAAVTLVDNQARSGRGFPWLTGDATAPAGEFATELGVADLAVLALPGPVALAALGPVATRLPAGAMLADTLSVKGPLAAAACAVPDTVEHVSLNPMAAPSLGLAGRPVSAVVFRGGPRTEALLDLIGGWGARIVRQDPVEHDRTTATTQALTHAALLAFGFTLTALDVDVAALAQTAPPPNTALLALLARIASAAPEVYWDIQADNPEAAGARTALATGLRRLATLVDSGDRGSFDAEIDDLRRFFGPSLAAYRSASEDLLTALPGNLPHSS